MADKQTLGFGGDSAQLLAEFQKIVRALDVMERRLEKVGNTSVRESEKAARARAKERDALASLTGSFDDSGAMLDKIGGKMGVVGAAIAGATMLFAGFKRQMEDIIRLNEQAAQKTTELAQSEQNLLLNTGNMPAQQLFVEMSKRTGKKVSSLQGAYASASAASGGDEKIALSATEVAAQASGVNVAAIPIMGGGVAAVQKATGGAGDVAFGQIKAISEVSGIQEMKDMMTAIPKTIAAIVAMGGEIKDVAAIMGPLTVASKDVTGQSSATATAQLSGKLREFFDTGAGKKTGINKSDFTEQILYMQGDEKLRKSFLGKLEQSEFKPFFEDMLSGGAAGKSAKEIAAKFGGMGGQQFSEVTSQSRGNIQGSELYQREKINMETEAGKEIYALENPLASTTANIKARLDEARAIQMKGMNIFEAPLTYGARAAFDIKRGVREDEYGPRSMLSELAVIEGLTPAIIDLKNTLEKNIKAQTDLNQTKKRTSGSAN